MLLFPSPSAATIPILKPRFFGGTFMDLQALPCWNSTFSSLLSLSAFEKNFFHCTECTRNNACGFTKKWGKFCCSKSLNQERKIDVWTWVLADREWKRVPRNIWFFLLNQPASNALLLYVRLICSPTYPVTRLVFLLPFPSLQLLQIPNCWLF